MITYEDRLSLSKYLEQGLKPCEIARKLGIHIATYYREIERGNNDGKYDPDYSQSKIRIKDRGGKGKKRKPYNRRSI